MRLTDDQRRRLATKAKGLGRKLLAEFATIVTVVPDTGQRYDDVIVFWVSDEGDKLALVQDDSSPFFTTPHFDGHLSVLLRASRVGELSRDELAEVVQDAWLSRASARRAARWLDEHAPDAASSAAPGRAR